MENGCLVQDNEIMGKILDDFCICIYDQRHNVCLESSFTDKRGVRFSTN